MSKSSRILSVGALCALFVSGCEVTNPGPVQDEFLAEPASQEGLVTGSERRISEAVGWISYTTALLSREIFPGGQTGASGHDVSTQGGHVQPGSYGNYFNDAQQARFIAETAIKRFLEVDAPDDVLFKAYLFAGYSYRILGENWCDAVIGSTDPDDPEPGSYEVGTDTYFERAIDNFTKAIAIAPTTDDRYAATAGRAAAYVWMEDWANAATDAATIPDDFVYWIEMDQTGGTDYQNQIYFAGANQPYRAYSIWMTFFEDYYTNTGDPRTPWVSDPDVPYANAALSGYGQVPWINQAKYTSRDDDIRLASGWEMRLIQAEAMLAQGQPYANAMALINQVRTRNISDNDSQPLAAAVANSATEAWTALKRERYVELWLEGRRMGDERRWMANGTPGSLDTPDWDAISTIFTDNPRSYCFDIPTSERDANPNVPALGG